VEENSVPVYFPRRHVPDVADVWFPIPEFGMGPVGGPGGYRQPASRYGKAPSRMATNIYVGNLVWECTMDDLVALFQDHGKVTRAQIITDRETGRSRGFGFVEMEDDQEAQAAIQALNGSMFRGRPLTVNEAKPREPRAGGGGGGGFSRGPRPGGFGGGGGGGYGDRGRRY
jgi:hypothetical protein